MFLCILLKDAQKVCVCECISVFSVSFNVFIILIVSDIVHENLKMGSDGESDQASGTSSDEVQSPTGVCLRNRVHRRISMEVRQACTCARWCNNYSKLAYVASLHSTLHPLSLLSFCSAHHLLLSASASWEIWVGWGAWGGGRSSLLMGSQCPGFMILIVVVLPEDHSSGW